MVKVFSQSHQYDDTWQIVTLAYFLRYPNPYASHVLACDVISRTFTPEGTLKTTRLIKKTGAVPKWFPKQFITRAETWVVEESEVDPDGRVVTSRTKNLDHVKIMQVQEDVVLREAEDGSTLQRVTANVVSNFGWGLTKKIEKYGVNKFKANLERSRQGISLVLQAVREHRLRLQPFTLVMVGEHSSAFATPSSQSRYWTDSDPRHQLTQMSGDASYRVGGSASSISSPPETLPTPTSAPRQSWIPRWISSRSPFTRSWQRDTAPSGDSAAASSLAGPDQTGV